jgi:hypothetical protein
MSRQCCRFLLRLRSAIVTCAKTLVTPKFTRQIARQMLPRLLPIMVWLALLQLPQKMLQRYTD